MKKWIKRTIVAVLLVIFLGSIGVIAFTLLQYRAAEELYGKATEQFVALQDGNRETEDSSAGQPAEPAPIVVDFEALRQVNEDVAGWIYCEGTVINYPVMHGSDDDFYLHHAYDSTYSASGSIFVGSESSAGFTDANTIIYGHHMKNKSMFATLSNWAEQAYYEEHPVMWLLTPQQDYKIVLFSGYTTAAGSETYRIFQKPGQTFSEYLKDVAAKSEFQADVELDENGRYVVLSTCAYVFDNARDVLHGMLVPVDSAGGILITGEEAGGETN